VIRIENDQHLASCDALRDPVDDRGIGGAADQELHLSLYDREVLGRRLEFHDVDGDDARLGIDLLEQRSPESRAASAVGSRFDDEVGLDFVQDLLGDPDVERVLDRLDPQPLVREQAAAVRPPEAEKARERRLA
jgi:hypothetical protein